MKKHGVEIVLIDEINECIQKNENNGWQFVPPVILAKPKILSQYYILTFEKED